MSDAVENSLGYMGAPQDEPGFYEKAELVWEVSTGAMGKKLDKDRDKLWKQELRVMDLGRAARDMPEGPMKFKALEAWRAAERSSKEAESQLNDLIRNHDEVARAISKYSLGVHRPVTVGLGIPPAVVTAGWVILVVSAAGFAIGFLAVGFNLFYSSMGFTKSFIEQGTDFVKAGGGAISAASEGFVKAAWTVAALTVGVLGYQWWRKKGRSRAPAAKAISVPSAPLRLKPVSGTVF